MTETAKLTNTHIKNSLGAATATEELIQPAKYFIVVRPAKGLFFIYSQDSTPTFGLGKGRNLFFQYFFIGTPCWGHSINHKSNKFITPMVSDTEDK